MWDMLSKDDAAACRGNVPAVAVLTTVIPIRPSARSIEHPKHLRLHLCLHPHRFGIALQRLATNAGPLRFELSTDTCQETWAALGIGILAIRIGLGRRVFFQAPRMRLHDPRTRWSYVDGNDSMRTGQEASSSLQWSKR